MPCTCTAYVTCPACRAEHDEATLRGYVAAADREAALRQLEYERECSACVRCGGPAYHGVCDDRACQAVGVACGPLSGAEKAALRCALCHALASAEDARAWSWCPGFWDGAAWRSPCCLGCFEKYVEYDPESGEYARR